MIIVETNKKEHDELIDVMFKFYDELIGDGTDKDLIYAYIESMMSVTAVIDNYVHKILILGL